MKLFAIIKILFVLFGLYLAANFGFLYYNNFELKSRLRIVAKQAGNLHDYEVIDLLRKDIRELKIPADPTQIQVRRDGQRAEISLKYRRSIVIKFGKHKLKLLELGFSPTVIESY
jgi:hypothetical protein